MISNVDVLAFSLSDGVLSYENSTEVVALDGDRAEYKSNFLEKLSDPDDLAAAIGERHVLCFCGRKRNCALES